MATKTKTTKPKATRTKTTKTPSVAGAKAPIRAFKDANAWEAWLSKNQTAADGVWIRIAKKASGKKSVTQPDAVEVALCYGWIDAQGRPDSATAWLQRFVPRRPRSIWSKINRERALALIDSGRMRPAGLEQVERAKQDGRWEAAYDSSRTATIPPALERELQLHPKAQAFFKTISAANRYAILWRLQTAKKPETRAKRLRTFIEMLENGETIH